MRSKSQHLDIARSGYADMLNDDERNRAYDSAIKINVALLVRTVKFNPSGDRYFNCCDIGTGSGLLSMMIVRAFKDLGYEKFHVTAFEAFKPMAECAKRVIACNEMSNFITVNSMNSSQYKKQANFDLLVAELLDTELIGENCLSIYRDAIANLCSKDCLFVPYEARIFIEPVASMFLFKRHAIDNLKFRLDDKRTIEIEIPEAMRNCCGVPEIDDMQVSKLHEGSDFIRICQPKEAFHFVFGDSNQLRLSEHSEIDFITKEVISQPSVIIMWWEINMFDSALVEKLGADIEFPEVRLDKLSCAPVWARDEEMLKRDEVVRKLYGREVWREHWIQGVYYFSSIKKTKDLMELGVGEQFTVHAYHDAFSLWFDVEPCLQALPPNCSCKLHRRLSRTQLALLSNTDIMSKLLAAALKEKDFPIKAEIEFNIEPSEWEIQSNEDFHVKKSINLTEAMWCIKMYNESAQRNDTNTVTVYDMCLTKWMPWDKILRLYLHQPDDMDPIKSVVLKCTQVRFDNLNRIKTNRGHCEGFNLVELDSMVDQSSRKVDETVEPHNLWEYSCRRIDKDYTLYTTSGIRDAKEIERIREGTYWKRLKLPVCREQDQSWRSGWALVFWAELTLQHTDGVISTGPIKECSLNEYFEWNRYCKQSVYFLHDYPINSSNDQWIDIDVGLRDYTSCIWILVQRDIDHKSVHGR